MGKPSIPETIILSEFIHQMANNVYKTNEDYCEALKLLTSNQKDQIFFISRKVKRKSRPLLQPPRIIRHISHSDSKIIYMYYQAGASLTDIYKIFFQDKFITYHKFYYNLHKDKDLSRQLQVLDKRRKKSYK